MELRRSDAELVRDSVMAPDLFTIVYERHRREVVRFAARRVGPEIAEDLTAEDGSASPGTSSNRRHATTNTSLTTSSARPASIRRRAYASTAAE
jgi:hypothetical protein